MDDITGMEQVPTVVVGGGQAGLTMAYHLRRIGEEFVVLDADARTGDSWRQRWDSLRLFSLPRYSSLPGRPMRQPGFPTHDQMADYLEDYANHFGFPIRHRTRVLRLTRRGDHFSLQTDAGPLTADRVVVATGGERGPYRPGFAERLEPRIRQLHSADFRRPEQLAGEVLVVGAGNSGVDIALQAAAAGHPTVIAGRHPGQVPFDVDKPTSRLAIAMVMFAFRHILTLSTPPGRAMAAKVDGHGVMLVRYKLADLEHAGVRQVGRVADVVGGRPVLADGEVLTPDTVVWCTGFRPDHSWIDLPIFDETGRVQHRRGVVTAEPGLYLLGMPFQYAVASATIQGLDRDARHLLADLRSHRRAVPQAA
jgi:putative flavoprotein involved in K+ transport